MAYNLSAHGALTRFLEDGKIGFLSVKKVKKLVFFSFLCVIPNKIFSNYFLTNHPLLINIFFGNSTKEFYVHIKLLDSTEHKSINQLHKEKIVQSQILQFFLKTLRRSQVFHNCKNFTIKIVTILT